MSVLLGATCSCECIDELGCCEDSGASVVCDVFMFNLLGNCILFGVGVDVDRSVFFSPCLLRILLFKALFSFSRRDEEGLVPIGSDPGRVSMTVVV